MNNIPFFIVLILIIASCASTPSSQEDVAGPQETSPAVASDTVETPVEQTEEHEFEVTQVVYEKTFSEIEKLIEELNTVIAQREFLRWQSFVSEAYLKQYSSKEVFDKYNQYPQLAEQGIVLTTLEDYFNVVVVPSRSNAVLDEIVFVDQHRVIAYSSYEGQRAKLYELEKIDELWKISAW